MDPVIASTTTFDGAAQKFDDTTTPLGRLNLTKMSMAPFVHTPEARDRTTHPCLSTSWWNKAFQNVSVLPLSLPLPNDGFMAALYTRSVPFLVPISRPIGTEDKKKRVVCVCMHASCACGLDGILSHLHQTSSNSKNSRT